MRLTTTILSTINNTNALLNNTNNSIYNYTNTTMYFEKRS